MGDMGDTFRALKDESKDRRSRHREQSPKLLEATGISFEQKNGGAHLIVEGHNGHIDFWPGTGRWIPRKGSYSPQFGVKNLIKFVNKEILCSKD